MGRKIWQILVVIGLLGSWGCALGQTNTPTVTHTATPTATPSTYLPAAAFVAVNNNGRPMGGAVVTVTDTNGGAVTVYGNSSGSQVYSGTVPATGIVQFFGNVGTYLVTVSGSGVTRQYQATIAATAMGSGITSINSETGPAITINSGSSGTDFNIDSSGNLITINIPDASATARGLVTAGTQTIAGAKTFTGFGVSNQGWTFNESGSGAATNDVRIETDTSTHAFFSDAGTDAIGFFTSNPGLFGSNVYIAGQTGKTGLVVTSLTDEIAIIGSAISGGAGVSGAAGGTGWAILGQAVSANAMAGQFERSIDAASVPVVEMIRNTDGDEQPILEIEEDDPMTTAVYSVRGVLDGNPVWGITPDGLFQGEPNATFPVFGFRGDNDSGLASVLGAPCLMEEGACVLITAASLVSIVSADLDVDGNIDASNGQITGLPHISNPVFGFYGDADSGLASASGSPCLVDEGTCVVLAVPGLATVTGELQITGVTGSGAAVCVKGDGNLGTCSDAVGGGGTCTCG